MKRNLLKFCMFIVQSYSRILSKEWTQQRDVILGDVILMSPFPRWKMKNYIENFGHYIESDWVDEKNWYNRDRDKC